MYCLFQAVLNRNHLKIIFWPNYFVDQNLYFEMASDIVISSGVFMKKKLFVLVVLLFHPLVALSQEIPPLEGLVEPWETVSVSAPVPGILEKVRVERCSWVKPGMVIAQLKSGVEQAGVQLAQARVDFGKRKLARNQELYTRKLVSIHERDEQETELKLAQMELKVVQEKLNLLTIKSTIEGVVVECLGVAGEYVGEQPFMTIARINPLRVEVIAPVFLYGSIHVGDTADVQIEEPVNDRFVAKVVIVDKVMDAASGTFGIRLELPNKALKLPAGLKCKVLFNPAAQTPSQPSNDLRKSKQES